MILMLTMIIRSLTFWALQGLHPCSTAHGNATPPPTELRRLISSIGASKSRKLAYLSWEGTEQTETATCEKKCTVLFSAAPSLWRYVVLHHNLQIIGCSLPLLVLWTLWNFCLFQRQCPRTPDRRRYFPETNKPGILFESMIRSLFSHCQWDMWIQFPKSNSWN